MFDLSVPGLLAQSVSWLVSSARQAYSLSLTSHHTMLYKQSAASSSSTNTNLTSLRDKHKSPPQPSPHSSPIYSTFHLTPQYRILLKSLKLFRTLLQIQSVFRAEISRDVVKVNVASSAVLCTGRESCPQPSSQLYQGKRNLQTWTGI